MYIPTLQVIFKKYVVKSTIAVHSYISSIHEYKKVESNSGSALKVTRNEKINKIRKDPGFASQLGQPLNNIS
jgi:hypothetical protein